MKRVQLTVALVLMAVLLLQWRDWPQESAQAIAPESSGAVVDMPEAPSAAESAPIPRHKEDYAGVMERPLFLPDRRPPENEPVEGSVDGQAAEVTDLSGLDLTATLILSPTDASIWVRDPERPALLRLRLGDDFKGWTVAKIEGDRVVMERQGVEETLNLLDFSEKSLGSQQPTQPTRRGTVEGRRSGRMPVPSPVQ